MSSAVEQKTENEVIGNTIARMPTPESPATEEDPRASKPTVIITTNSDPSTPTQNPAAAAAAATLSSPLSPTQPKTAASPQPPSSSGVGYAKGSGYGRGNGRRFDSTTHTPRRVDKRASFNSPHTSISSPGHTYHHLQHPPLPPPHPHHPHPHHHQLQLPPHHLPHGYVDHLHPGVGVMPPPPLPGHFAPVYQMDPASYNIAAAAAHAAAAAAGMSPYSEPPSSVSASTPAVAAGSPPSQPQQQPQQQQPDPSTAPPPPPPPHMIMSYHPYYAPHLAPPTANYFYGPNGMLYQAAPTPPPPPPPQQASTQSNSPNTQPEYYTFMPHPPPPSFGQPAYFGGVAAPSTLPVPPSVAPSSVAHEGGEYLTPMMTPQQVVAGASPGEGGRSSAVSTPRRGSVGVGEKGSHTNLYVRGLGGGATDAWLFDLCKGYGTITSSKAIVDLVTRECKGFGFVMYETETEARSAMDGLARQGFQVSFAKTDPRAPSTQESFNARLQNLQDEDSTNIYVSNLPLDMDEEGLKALFAPHKVVSTKILRDSTRSSRGVGFARMSTRDSAQNVIDTLNNTMVAGSSQKLQVRYADSFAQKRLKMEHQLGRDGRRRGGVGVGSSPGSSVFGDEESEVSFYEG
ncbi:hypothetical protein HDU67_007345, partial [Dinochytrium kinnereticum]